MMSSQRSRAQKKLTKQRKKRRERLIAQLEPSTQNTLFYTSNFQDGLMHIVEDEYSLAFKLGNIDYDMATEDQKLDVVLSYAEALNSLDASSRYQLLVINHKVKSDLLNQVQIEYNGDGKDELRSEVNELISSRYEHDHNNFEIEKFAIFSTEARDRQMAMRKLQGMGKNYLRKFLDSDVDLEVKQLDGEARLEVMNQILRPGKTFNYSYEDLELTGLTSKSLVAPSRLKFFEKYFRMDNKFSKVMYVRRYPTLLEDRLIMDLCNTGIELSISIHAKPYDLTNYRKSLQVKKVMNKAQIIKQQKENFKHGLSDDMISGEANEIRRASDELLNDIKDNGQKVYSGIFSVMFSADTEEELQQITETIEEVGRVLQVDFEEVGRAQEEGLNSILPIGKPYLDVEKNYMRDMTTSNVVTQIPWSNLELQSPTGKYYGQNQLTNNLITVNRKKDLETPSGLIFGSSGSGKGMTTKWEIITTLLKYPNDRVIIVDPESEYLNIGRQFGAEILDISTGTGNHLNLLDLADRNKLDDEDKNLDLIKEKANLITDIFDTILKDFSDMEAGIVDRVTHMTYEYAEENKQTPTMFIWQKILEKQPEEVAKNLALKTAPYTTGSQNIFAYETNVNLDSRFVILNTKKLDPRLKPFASKVIFDQIWKQIVANKDKATTWLYFDELQVNFNTEASANWFTILWSRIRKYGAIATGITQNVSTLLSTEAGRKMISNSEFIILLKQKIVDLEALTKVVKLTPQQIKYVEKPTEKGSGLIVAGSVIVPFMNQIPKKTKLFEIMNTDAA